jgi:hypothetical protein
MYSILARHRALFRACGLTIVFAAFVLLIIAGRGTYSAFNYTLF